MKTHVLLQIIQAIAPAIAIVTLIRHKIAVHDHVAVQVADLLESLAANCADVRAFVHVRGRDVRLQVRLPDERGLAHVALERSYIRVNRQMRLEDVLVLEVLLAQVTLERSLIVVHLLVH